jgi:hypothetical protein
MVNYIRLYSQIKKINKTKILGQQKLNIEHIIYTIITNTKDKKFDIIVYFSINNYSKILGKVKVLQKLLTE